MKKKKILVLGASGFIGKNIALNLSKNKKNSVSGTYFKNKVIIKNVRMIKSNLTLRKDVDKVIKGNDIVIQAAATTSGAKDIIQKPYIHVNDNSIINSMITRACFNYKIKHVVFFSCSIMYNPYSKKLQKEENIDVKKIYDGYFGAAHMKIFVENMCKFYSNLGRNRYTVIRHSNVYGPHDKFSLEKSHVLAGTINKVFSSKKEVVVWGDGKEKRDLIYISDLVDFVKIVIKKQKNKFGLYNVGSEKLISINELTDKIIKISNKNLKKINDLSKKNLKTYICLDCSKAKKEFKWRPKINLDIGIKKTIKWYYSKIC
jgi:GDP-L-fucose synthase